MAKIIGTRAGGVSLVTLVAAGVIKPLTEQALIPIVGDGNLLSGAAKLGGALMVNQFAGRGIIQDAASIALGVDGIEDIMRGVFGMGGSQTSGYIGGAI